LFVGSSRSGNEMACTLPGLAKVATHPCVADPHVAHVHPTAILPTGRYTVQIRAPHVPAGIRYGRVEVGTEVQSRLG
jgi:hypothetical protein